jgi:predicted transporter
MERKPFIASFLLFVFGLVFIGLFRTNLTGQVVAETKGEAAYHGLLSGVYLYLGLSFVLFAIIVFVYFKYREEINNWFVGNEE